MSASTTLILGGGWGGMTAAHHLRALLPAEHRIIVIEHGRISEQGSHQQLMTDRGHYFDLYRQQSLQESSRARRTGRAATSVSFTT